MQRTAGGGGGRRWVRRTLLGLGVGVAAAAVGLGLRLMPLMQEAEARTYDARVQRLTDPARADTNIVFVAIDDNSMEVYRDQLGRWPWPRDVYASVLEYLRAGGARLAVFDIEFPEPNLADPVGDTIFAEDLAATGLSVLPFTFSPGDSSEAALWEQNRAQAPDGRALIQRARAMLAAHSLGTAEAPDPDLVFPYVEPVYPLFGEQARALGSIVWNPDADGVSRRERLVYAHQGRLYPSLPLAAARVLDPDRFGGTPVVSARDLRFPGERVPLHDGRFIIRWRGPYLQDRVSAYRIYPVFHVLNSFNAVQTGRTPDVPLAAFRNKIVFIAATAIGVHDIRATAVAPHDPGVIIHATILDDLLHGDYMRRAPALANAGMVAFAGVAAGLVSAVFGSAVVASLGSLLVLLLAVGVAVLAFTQGVWLDMAAPVLTGAMAYAGVMAGSYMTEGREKKRVRDLFGRYVTPEYVKRLADNFESVKLGGERIPLTLLFSDIRGFTSLSEKLPAETVIEMLNAYLDRMAEVVFRHGGTLDKFIGDAVMAFWGAPVPVEDHAQRAVETALDMLDELAVLNEGWAAAGAPAQLRIGIGINTGEAIVGNIGSLARKLDYTAIGDTVNLASRLESQNKEYGTSIIVSEFTMARLPDQYDLRPIDQVRVKGKEQAVQIYELLGRKKGARPRSGAAPLLAGLLVAGALGVVAPPPVAAQQAQKIHWTDWVYQPGTWHGDRFAPLQTRDQATDALGLIARVECYARPPKWRAEVRHVVAGDSLGDTVVLVGNGNDVVVLTPLGSTPLANHEAAKDPVVQALVGRMNAQGRPDPAPPTRVVKSGSGGVVAQVVLRKNAARADFDDHLLDTGAASRVGRRLALLGMQAVGGERDQDVVASAGARGVATVKTTKGEITVMPDTAAVLRLEKQNVGVLELDRFLRQEGIRRVSDEKPKGEDGP